MANLKISQLPTATTPLAGTETTIVIQGGVTKQAPSASFALTPLATTAGAGLVGFTPTGTIAATTVQGAIAEVVSELAASSGSSLVGFIQSGTGAIQRTIQDKSRDYVSVKDFGAIGNGIVNDTAAINAAIAYAALNSKSVFIPDGTFLLDTVTFIDPTGLFAQRGQNIFGMLFAKSNVTIFGNGKNSIIKVAANQLTKTFVYIADINSGTYANWAMPGTKGFQLFVNESPTIAVDNFVVRDLTLDFNGLNNKMYPINSFGNQSSCHGVAIEKGDDILIHNVVFLNSPGSQVIYLGYSTTTSIVSNCTFINSGVLDGTNVNLTDHSSIYIGGLNYEVFGNTLTQQATMLYGCAIEMHGVGINRNNFVSKYSSFGVTSALVKNGDHIISGNIGKSLFGGLGIYCQNTFTLNTKISDNDFEFSNSAVPPTSVIYRYRNAIYAGNANIGYSPGAVNITVLNNSFAMVGTVGWGTEAEDLYNSFSVISSIKTFTAQGNLIQGFRGPLLSIQEQAVGAGASFVNNNVISCGRNDTWQDKNGLINYDNGDNVSSGNKLLTLYLANNTYSSCFYTSYLNLTCVVTGKLISPLSVRIDGEVHDRYLSTLYLKTGFDISSSCTQSFNYKVNGVVDTNKPFPDTTPTYTYANNYSYGKVICEEVAGTPCEFYKVKSSSGWNFKGILINPVSPTVARPFGSLQGDIYSVMRGVTTGPSGYYCTVSGSPGTWKTFSLIS